MKNKIRCLLFIVLGFNIGLSSCATLSNKEITISETTLPLDSTAYPFLVSDGYLWDTGSTHSLVIDEVNNLSESKLVSKRIAQDAKGKWMTVNLKRYAMVQIGELAITNGVFAHLPREAVGDSLVWHKFPKGIIGMNIISRANWLFNLKDRTITAFSVDSIPIIYQSKALKLNYSSSKHPKVKLNVEGITIPVTVDMGSNTFLALKPKYIRKLNKIRKPYVVEQDYALSLFADRTPCSIYYYEEMHLEHLKVLPLIVQESKFNHIGVGLFNKFSQILILGNDKVIYLIP